jgi:predicted  nucleic acid-binding Zn-ribbon protein
MTPELVLELHDLDLLRAELAERGGLARLSRMGFTVDAPHALERARTRLLESVDHRWLHHYERARLRYGRGVVAVRDRVCLGCFVTLPTSTNPGAGDSLTVCESCGRVLVWR